MEEIRANSAPNVFNNYDDTDGIVADFRRQLIAYTYQEIPFLYSPGIEPRDYWKKLVPNKDASVLAVRHLESSFLRLNYAMADCVSPILDPWTQVVLSGTKLNG